MTKEEIIEMARQAGLHVANDSEGQFSGVTSSEMTDMYPDPNKERDRLHREKVFIEVLAPFAELVAEKEREECAKLCESMWHEWLDSPEENEPNKPDAEDCYRAIRRRGQE